MRLYVGGVGIGQVTKECRSRAGRPSFLLVRATGYQRSWKMPSMVSMRPRGVTSATSARSERRTDPIPQPCAAPMDAAPPGRFWTTPMPQTREIQPFSGGAPTACAIYLDVATCFVDREGTWAGARRTAQDATRHPGIDSSYRKGFYSMRDTRHTWKMRHVG